MDDPAAVDGDLALIERARAGDVAAFERLVAPLIEPVARHGEPPLLRLAVEPGRRVPARTAGGQDWTWDGTDWSPGAIP